MDFSVGEAGNNDKFNNNQTRSWRSNGERKLCRKCSLKMQNAITYAGQHSVSILYTHVLFLIVLSVTRGEDRAIGFRLELCRLESSQSSSNAESSSEAYFRGCPREKAAVIREVRKETNVGARSVSLLLT